MRKPEQLLWDAIRRVVPSGYWLQRIENSAGEGMADLLCSCRATQKSAFIELKAPKRPKFVSTRLMRTAELSAAQINWHTKAAIYGLRTFILARDDHNQVYLFPGTMAEKVNHISVQNALAHHSHSSLKTIFERLV